MKKSSKLKRAIIPTALGIAGGSIGFAAAGVPGAIAFGGISGGLGTNYNDLFFGSDMNESKRKRKRVKK